MNLYPHPRHLLVPRHARRSLVSLRSECSVTYFLILCRTLLCDASPLQQELKAADHTDHSGLLEPLHPLSPIQSTQPSLGAASFKSLYPKRPAKDHATADCSVGRFRYSTKTSGDLSGPARHQSVATGCQSSTRFPSGSVHQ